MHRAGRGALLEGELSLGGILRGEWFSVSDDGVAGSFAAEAASTVDVPPRRHDEIRRLTTGLREQACASRQRRLLVLAGDADWGRGVAGDLCRTLPLSPASWVSVHSPDAAESLAGRQALALLGQEREAVIFDAHSGFDPDVFGAVSGAVVGGGLLILLTPPLGQWPDFADPAAERISIAPLTFADVSGRFLQRLVRLLATAEGVTVVEQQTEQLPAIVTDAAPSEAAPVFDHDGFRSADQQTAVAALEHVIHGHRRRPVVLVADRGRGKSAALGIAAARLLREGLKRIVVTAPRIDAVAALFEQAACLLPEARQRRGHLQWREASIEFHPPDELLLNPRDADLLLVDEAAAIPTPLLTRLLERHSRIAFATTVHGYEGTGRGFAVRFRRVLDTLTPGWREVRLQTPIRWAADDPVEDLVFRALLLDASAAADEQVADAIPASCEFVRFDRDTLAADEQSLSQLFGLLVQAHYRTRPNDLRNLLDGPGLRVYALRHRGQIMATALVAAEGGFDADTAQAIAAGKRRPRGHLIPQSLAAHLGLADGACLRCARVMRIAVHPAAQRRGLGKLLLQHVRRQVEVDGFDLLGVSFGASEDLLAFWHNEKLLPVRLGFSRDHASGTYSAMLLRALGKRGEAIFTAARAQFIADLALQLGDPLRELDPLLAARLLRRSGEEGAPGTEMLLYAGDSEAVSAFASGARSFEDCLGPLYRLALRALVDPACELDVAGQRLLVAKLLQKRRWGEVAALLDVPGRAAVVDRLRQVACAIQKSSAWKCS